MKRKTALLILFVLLSSLLSSCAWMGLGRVSEIEATPPNRPDPAQPVSEHVAEFSGVGTMNTPLFTVERNWLIVWASPQDDTPFLTIYDSEENYYVGCSGTPLGVSYFYGVGTYYIHVSITGAWAIIVDYQ